MEQITAMKITQLELQNFRNQVDPETFELGDVSYISGHNGTGKTTLAHAVCYALFGVSYYGEQKIERLMNEDSDSVSVRMQFIDQNGNIHNIIRSRNKDKTYILLDGVTVRQAQIEAMFCERDMFLAMFNPTYLTECMDSADSRKLVLRHLGEVSNEDVLQEIGSCREYLDGVDLSTKPPEMLMSDFRAMIRGAEQQSDILKGNIDVVKQNLEASKKKLSDLYDERRKTDEEIKVLERKRNEGLDFGELAITKDLLLSQLQSAGNNAAEFELKAKLEQAKGRVYESKFTTAIAEAQAEVKLLTEKHGKLKKRVEAIRPGIKCPTCMMAITEQNIGAVKKGIIEELNGIAKQGREAVERLKEVTEMDKQSRLKFEEFKAADITKLTDEFNALNSASNTQDTAEIQARLDDVEYTLINGNLDEEELSRLKILEATLVGIDAQIEALKTETSEERLLDAITQQQIFAEQIEKYEKTISALREFLFKKAELATKGLEMPNVKFRLFEVIRTTGELKSVFKFEYKGREYTTLSLSEKTLAGIEIAAMMRRITGVDCPICVDNTESVAGFNPVAMPSQTVLLRFVKGIPLTVQVKNRTPAVQIQELRKAS